MDKKDQQTAEQQLREFAEKSNMTLRDLHQLFNRAFIDDDKVRQRMIEQQGKELQYLQNNLMALQYRNETMTNQLLTYELEQKIKEMEQEKADAAKQTEPKKKWSLFPKATSDAN